VAARKLDLNNPADLSLLRQLADERAPVSLRLGVRRHAWLLLFHAAVFFSQQLHYIESLDVVVISEVRDDRLLLVDVIGRQVPTLEQIYPFVGGAHVRDVDFGFAPDLLEVDRVTASVCHDANLFVRGDFAVGSSPFRFPTTSEA